MNVLGIDPSYGRTGIATAGDTRSYTPPAATADLPPHERAAVRRSWLRGQLGNAMHGRDLIAVEGMFKSLEYGVIDRAQLLGAIIDLARSITDAPILVVPPASVKLYATGNGNAAKSAMAEALDAARVTAPWVTHPANDDEADAWWIAAFAADFATGGRAAFVDRTPHQRGAVRALAPPYTRRHPSPWARTPTGG